MTWHLQNAGAGARSAWDPPRPSPAGSPRAWMGPNLALPTSLPRTPLSRAWTWRPGAKDCELGWPEEPELAQVTSWASSPCPHYTLKVFRLFPWGVGVRVGTPQSPPRRRQGWSPGLPGAAVSLIMNSIIEYIAFVLFYRKVTFCNRAMYIKLFIKVNILHNKRFLNSCVYNLVSFPFFSFP